MSFLKKILKRIDKSSVSSGFNLRKHAEKKVAYLEQEELGRSLTPLDAFEETSPTTTTTFPPETTLAMERYIEQNAEAEVPNPIPHDWVSNPDTSLYFQSLVSQKLGNMSDNFLGRVFQQTTVEDAYLSDEDIAKRRQQSEAPVEPQSWEDIAGDFGVDLVSEFFASPESERAIKSIAYAIGKRRNILDEEVNQEIAQQSVLRALGAPTGKARGSSLKRDQRFNYFLQDDVFNSLPPDIAKGIFNFMSQNPQASQDDKISYMKETFGNDLIDMLQQKIIGEDPSIKKWILKQEGAITGKDVTMPSEKGIHSTEEDTTGIEDNVSSETNKINRNTFAPPSGYEKQVQKDALSSAASNFVKYYLNNIIQDMKESSSMAVEKAYANPKSNPGHIERAGLYSKLLFEQYDSLFSDENAKIIPSRDGVTFQNKEGKVEIPMDYLVKVFKGNMDKTPKEQYNDVMEYRQSGEDDIDILDWFKESGEGDKKAGRSAMVTYNTLAKSYGDLHRLKSKVLEALKANNQPIDISKNPNLLKDGYATTSLDSFSNVFGNLDNDEIVRRRARFIDWTKQQSEIPAEQRYFDLYERSYNDSLVEPLLQKAKKAKKNPNILLTQEEMDTVKSIEEQKKAYEIQRKKYQKLKGTDNEIPMPVGKYLSTEEKSNAKPNAQYDMRTLMEPLLDIKQNETNSEGDPFSLDAFKGFLGALNPHKRHQRSSTYKQLLEKKDEDSERIEQLDSVARPTYEAIAKETEQIEGEIRERQRKYDKAQSGYESRIESANRKINTKINAINKKRKGSGQLPMTPEEYTGVAGWNGKAPLSIQDYNRVMAQHTINMSKDIQKILDYQNAMKNLNEMVPDDYYSEDEKKNEKKIRGVGLNILNQRLTDINDRMEKFKTQHGWTNAQELVARNLCLNYFKKISSIDSIRQRYVSMKIAANISILDEIREKVTIEYRKAFDLLLK